MRIAIIGTGNVGTHFFKALNGNPEHFVSLINSRNLEGLTPEFDLILLSVSDSVLKDVAEAVAGKMAGHDPIVAHTAGSVPMEILRPFFKNYGVFYPLQTFSKEIEIADYREIPIFIEGNSPIIVEKLREFAADFFDRQYILDSNKREKLHLASVFACNFSNAMYGIAEEILQENGLPFQVLLPLISQTADKVRRISPFHAQTGPARRGDTSVMDKHLSSLSDDSMKRDIYKALSELLLKKYQNEQNRL